MCYMFTSTYVYEYIKKLTLIYKKYIHVITSDYVYHHTFNP